LTPVRRAAFELWRNASKRQEYQGQRCDLTRAWVEEQVEAFCATRYHVLGVAKHPFQPSLHRINPAAGYTAANVRVVWLIENYALNTFTEADLLEFCRRKLGLQED
jgi:hypothetical protein